MQRSELQTNPTVKSNWDKEGCLYGTNYSSFSFCWQQCPAVSVHHLTHLSFYQFLHLLHIFSHCVPWFCPKNAAHRRMSRTPSICHCLAAKPEKKAHSQGATTWQHDTFILKYFCFNVLLLRKLRIQFGLCYDAASLTFKHLQSFSISLILLLNLELDCHSLEFRCRKCFSLVQLFYTSSFRLMYFSFSLLLFFFFNFLFLNCLRLNHLY